MALYNLPHQVLWTFPTPPAPVLHVQPPRPVLPVRPVPTPTLKEVNAVPLTRKVLKEALKDLSERLYHSFRRQVRLVVHGGAVMVLYPHFNHREYTQDVDYIHRSFVTEYRALGFADAGERLRRCIAETAYKFKLGADWMNDHADVALPMAYDHTGQMYDPIYTASIRENNAAPQTIFNERGLRLVAVPWPWAVALKLVRYEKNDPPDCAAVLRLGFKERGICWTLQSMEQWISERCWPMGYSDYQPPQREKLRHRIQDALRRAFPDGSGWSSSAVSASASASTPSLWLPHRTPQRMASDPRLFFAM
ncbi:hypothetical protein BGW80DRAFT_1457865 [Lactifluus volemus]|nr:hypothetical protein BGW80DRAFT_1457865 [Lactifluus volemus]